MNLPEFDSDYVRVSIESDAVDLAENLRTADLAELAANTGNHPKIVLLEGHLKSHPCLSVVYEGRTIAMFGVVPTTTPNIGAVWLLASKAMEPDRLPMAAKLRFLRASRRWVDWLNEQYPVLWNVVDARNTLHIDWLKWCGFELLRTIDNYGKQKRPFIEFARSHHV